MEGTLLLTTAAERAVARNDFASYMDSARRLEPAAWDYLYAMAFPQLYRYVAAKVACRQDAEDVTEETFAGALQSIGSLRARDEAGFLAWLFQIARFKIADRLRSQYRRPTESLDDSFDRAGSDPSPEEEAVRADAQVAVRAALAKLTPEQQEVILMKFVLDYDNTRAGALLGKSPGAVNQMQHRALSQLRKILSRKGA